VAFLASVVLHLLVLFLSRSPLTDAPPAPPVLTARLQAPPQPAEKPQASPPPAPPEVIKNTLAPPKAEKLDDYIKPQPKRQITDKPEEHKTPTAKTPPQPRPPAPERGSAKPEAPPPPPVATLPEAPTAPRERRPLDLSVPTGPRAERLSPEELNETLSRLSEAILYPSEALRRGLEGEVTILVEIGDGGRILGASVASGSGHPLLDDAAVRAVRKLGTLGPSTANRTILLPVRFKII
jgi:protein TonB